jgi:hypothetical protein
MIITIEPGAQIDEVLKANRAPGTQFRLLPGNYRTQGCFAFDEHDLCMLAPGCSLIGAGSDVTCITLERPVLEHKGEPTKYTEIVTGGARTLGHSHGVAASGFSISNPWQIPTVGVHLWTARARMEDIAVNDTWGDREWPGEVKEGFGILAEDTKAEGQSQGGHRLKNCRVKAVSQPLGRESYITGIYASSLDPASEMTHVRDCSVVGPVTGKAHAGFAFNCNTTLIDCEVVNCIRAVFMDTGAVVQNGLIIRMRATGVSWGLDIRAVDSGDIRANVLVSDSHFVFGDAGGDGWAQVVLLSDDAKKKGATFWGIDFKECRFVSPARGRASMGRHLGPKVEPATFMSCRWAGPVAWETYIARKA